MRASFVKEVIFELCLEGWGGFSQAAGVGGGRLQAPGRSDGKGPMGAGGKAWYDFRVLRAGQCG